MPESDAALVADILATLADVPEGAVLSGTGWRMEVTHRGRYYHWRRGGGKRREYFKGGQFSKRPIEEQEAYRARTEIRKARKAQDAG